MLRHERPDPDELLRQVQSAEAQAARGKLKVFLGASAGVGKTFAMLSEAREQRARGVDVVIGYAETHGRKETDALLEGIEILPRKSLEYRGVALEEFDIDGALARHPKLILVDEFAHSNAPGSLHPKRYQDIEELLQAGIDVHTTINIQHIDSLTDVVAQVTGIVVRETVPDSVLDRADEIELVDIPPKELQQRLREGKVYLPERVENALEGFFREGNLIALRELALRKTADRVDAQMQSYRAEQKVNAVWATKERILVCIAPNRLGTRVVRAAARIGSTSHAEMIAVYVESDRQVDRPIEEQRQAQEALRLAERLGMQTLSSGGHDIVAEILRIAQERNATLIVVGKPLKSRWREFVGGSVVDELVRRSGDIDVHVITGEADDSTRRRTEERVPQPWNGIVATVAVTALATGLCYVLRLFLAPPNLVMIYLLGVAAIASRYTAREAVLASVLSVAAFDFLFVPPYFTLSVSNTQYLLTFLMMLVVALLISGLAIRLRRQAGLWQIRERRSAALYRLSRNLAKSRSTREIAVISAREIGDLFHGDVAVLLKREGTSLEVIAKSRSRYEDDVNDLAAIHWVAEKGEQAGKGTNTLPSVQALYLPLIGTRGPIGVLGIRTDTLLDSQQENLLETFANGLALAIERTLLAKESHVSRLAAEAEKMRNVLLNSVSHDLRTPLTIISGAASALAEKKGDAEELAKTIVAQSEHLNRHVQNLLDMTRLEASTINPNFEWHSVEELIGSALRQAQDLLKGRTVKTFIPPRMALVRVDGILVEKALINLLENAVRHTPEGTDIEVRVSLPAKMLRIQIADHGPGVPKGDEERIFEKFYQPGGASDDRGFGLGLAICKAVAQAHGGSVWAENRPGGGARFFLELSTSGEPPEVPFE